MEYSSGSVRRIFTTMLERLSVMTSGVPYRKIRDGEAPNREKPKKYHQTIGRGARIPSHDAFERSIVEIIDVIDAVRRLPEDQLMMIKMSQFGYDNNEIACRYESTGEDIRFKLNKIYQKLARWCNGSKKPGITALDSVDSYIEKIII